MSTTEQLDLETYTRTVAEQAQVASRAMASLGGAAKIAWLRASAVAVRDHTDQILAANARDIAAAPEYGLTDAQIDRLRLTPERIDGIATALEEVAALPDPIGSVIAFDRAAKRFADRQGPRARSAWCSSSTSPDPT